MIREAWEAVTDPLNWWVFAWFCAGLGIGVLVMAVAYR